ncbi:glutathione S-transferase family protein [Novosphingobium sp. AP12]|uniref:glutathione S-transferase family protein n=1 Tax=Novosphingobium sp. AP12 TaxID=1144305 RepID=UPI00138AC213|nr:glutathione S-transferase family protein [Novosphingobium sp. AP12]
MFDPVPVPRKVGLYLALKGLPPIETEQFNIFLGETRTPEFLARNPAATVPVLETDDGHAIVESFAIMHYLEDLYPDPPMRGASEEERRRVDTQAALAKEFYYYYACTTVHTTAYLSRRNPVQAIDLAAAPLWRIVLEQISHVMEDRPFLAGVQPTMADCMLYPMFEYTLAVYGFTFPPHLKALGRWYDRVAALPGCPSLLLDESFHDQLMAAHGRRF